MTSAPQVPPVEPPGAELLDEDHDALCVAFSPDGRLVAYAGGRYVTVRRWPTRTIRWRTKVEGRLDAVDAVAFSPDGQRLVTVLDDAVHIVDVASGGTELTIEHDVPLRDVAFHPDGTRLVTAGEDGTARLWSLEGELVLELAHRKSLNAVGFVPDGSRLVTASDDHAVRVWDLGRAEPVLILPHDGPVVTVAVSPDGRRVLTGGADRTARLWDADSGEELFRLPHRRAVRTAVFDGDGGRIATVAAERTVRIWDALSGALRVELRHDERPEDAAFSPDGRRLVTAAFATQIWRLPPLDEPGTVRLVSGGTVDRDAPDDEPVPRSYLVIGAVMLVTIGWLLVGPDASIGDRLWGIGGAVSVAFGLVFGLEMRGFGAGSPRYRAEVLELERLGEGEGFRATVAVTLGVGTRLVLPLEAENKCPRTGATVALTKGEDCLTADDDPRQADGATLMHPLEIYGWPATFIGLGASALMLRFLPD